MAVFSQVGGCTCCVNGCTAVLNLTASNDKRLYGCSYATASRLRFLHRMARARFRALDSSKRRRN